MSHVPHELSEDFPQAADKIASLKTKDAHFANLCDRYHELNRAIHRAETNIEPTDDTHMTEMRRERMTLKDTIARYLA
ncbi:YdcH family protein [Oceanibium sediminis]|uniref:YdcH family protein n=1 Tax=Oceanibium sediminis TaxID=2026339 RepID=UPI000DD370F2|nr:DUF465 domain-containing protein [Oceanibium sediminis]